MTIKVPREPGRPHRFHRNLRLGNRNTNSPEPPVARRRPTGANHRRTRWYRQAKATKQGETDDGESERLIVSVKRGNPSDGTPWREGGAVS